MSHADQHHHREVERRAKKEARRRRKAARLDGAAIVVPVPLKRTNRGRDQEDVKTNGRV
jgi:hypothetical protein